VKGVLAAASAAAAAMGVTDVFPRKIVSGRSDRVVAAAAAVRTQWPTSVIRDKSPL